MDAGSSRIRGLFYLAGLAWLRSLGKATNARMKAIRLWISYLFDPVFRLAFNMTFWLGRLSRSRIGTLGRLSRLRIGKLDFWGPTEFLSYCQAGVQRLEKLDPDLHSTLTRHQRMTFFYSPKHLDQAYSLWYFSIDDSYTSWKADGLIARLVYAAYLSNSGWPRVVTREDRPSVRALHTEVWAKTSAWLSAHSFPEPLVNAFREQLQSGRVTGTVDLGASGQSMHAGPIVIRFDWTADELLRAQSYHFRHICRPVFRFALHFIFALMILAGYGGIHSGGVGVPIGIAFIVTGIYWFVFRRFERRWSVRRQFRNRPDQGVELEWQMTPDKIRTRSTLGQSEFTWQAFAKMVRTPNGVLFYPTDQIFQWLPRSGFASDTDFQRCVELARAKIGRHYDVV